MFHRLRMKQPYFVKKEDDKKPKEMEDQFTKPEEIEYNGP